MSKALTVKNTDMAALEKVLIKGDLAGLNEQQRLTYVKLLCKTIGVSPLFQPFDYITFQGKLVIYAKRSCTEQLRNRRKISIKIIARERVDGLYVVTAQARDKEGREDESIGAVNIKGLGGKDLENALMRAETKAKRRVTLSICGLGIMDELEAEDVAKAEAKLITETSVEETTAKIAETVKRPEFEAERAVPSIEQPALAPALDSEYTLKVVRGLKGKKISHVPLKKLADWIEFYDKSASAGAPLAPEIQDEAIQIRAFLEESHLVQQKMQENKSDGQ